ncbi:hypothetical protein [Ancylobacter terrae]|uniref:hypothetical protein n=1 Tax=Ancylobacter sp. sgz301288 TaxID=3342077 RepID=UPI00385C10DE
MSEPTAAPASGGRRLFARLLLTVGLTLNFLLLLLWVGVAGFDLAGFAQLLSTPMGLVFFGGPVVVIIVAAILASRGRTMAAGVVALVSGLFLLLI